MYFSFKSYFLTAIPNNLTLSYLNMNCKFQLSFVYQTYNFQHLGWRTGCGYYEYNRKPYKEAGKTTFYRLAIDINTLTVMIDDFSFTKSQSRSVHPYMDPLKRKR